MPPYYPANIKFNTKEISTEWQQSIYRIPITHPPNPKHISNEKQPTFHQQAATESQASILKPNGTATERQPKENRNPKEYQLHATGLLNDYHPTFHRTSSVSISARSFLVGIFSKARACCSSTRFSRAIRRLPSDDARYTSSHSVAYMECNYAGRHYTCGSAEIQRKHPYALWKGLVRL